MDESIASSILFVREKLEVLRKHYEVLIANQKDALPNLRTLTSLLALLITWRTWMLARTSLIKLSDFITMVYAYHEFSIIDCFFNVFCSFDRAFKKVLGGWLLAKHL